MRAAIERKRRGDPLDARERAVMDLLLDGRRPKQVCQALDISSSCFWYRRRCAEKKLGASTTLQALVKYALQRKGKR